ncbi:MAG: DUF389 domain-containing protein [Flavobacteriales bacterium]|nr:DUF389 domain-containing protein [Flavobacteriales bacterium]
MAEEELPKKPEETAGRHESEQQREAEKQAADKAQRGFRIALNNTWAFLQSILSLSEGLDKEATTEGIKMDVEFRGHAAWILVASIMIASIGLSVGNIPIIVGAMLISPLMGPILGIGLAAGTNDFELLKRSLTNFAIAIAISVVISTLYFLIVPTPEINAELLDRKTATLLSIAVAFFGGFAGIIAGSRSYKSNVVPGVAIATALMPPLCTVGFGIANAELDFIIGALYLFFINSIFIALPTYLYIHYMQFPVKEFIDPMRERKIKRRIAFFLVLIIIPGGIIFVNVIRQSFFSRNASQFLVAVEETLEDKNITIIDKQVSYDADHPKIKIALMGDPVSQDTRERWEDLRAEFGLEGCQLEIREPRDFTEAIEDLRQENLNNSAGQIEDFYRSEIEERDARIDELERRLNQYENSEGTFDDISAEVKMLFPEIQRAAYSNLVETSFNTAADTIPTLMVQWPEDMTEEQILASRDQLSRWLSARLKDDKARVIGYSLE